MKKLTLLLAMIFSINLSSAEKGGLFYCVQ